MTSPSSPSTLHDVEPLSRLPSVPAYAWAWLQRSRPVLDEIARRLTGGPPTRAFVEDLPHAFATDPFTCDVVVDIVAEVAFHGRVPARRPAHAGWDRGLTWWAATLAGTTPAEYAAASVATPGEQGALFEPPPSAVGPPTARRTEPPAAALPPVSRERRALADALRELVGQSDGGQVPATALRQLIAQLDPSSTVT